MKRFFPIAIIFLLALFLRTYNLANQPPGLTWAIFGALAVIGIYLLTNLLFGSEAKSRIAALVLALMPWHLHFSRGGWEVNTFVTMVLFGTYFFITSLKNNKVSPLWAALLFALSIFTYQAGKLLTPIIFATCVLVYWQDAKARLSQILKNEKALFPVYLLLIGAVAVYFYISVIGPAGNRVSRLSIFQYRPKPSQELIKTDNGSLLSVALFHSQIDLTTRAVASRYLYHFSPELLFFENSTPREALPKMGLLYLFDAVWIFFGLVFLIRSKDWRSKIILFVLLLSAPIGASLTLSEFSVVRALFLTVPLAILISLGIYHLVGDTSLSDFDLTTEIAKQFGFDQSKIARNSLAEFNKSAPRPYQQRMAMSNQKFESQFGNTFSSFSDALATMKSQMKKTE